MPSVARELRVERPIYTMNQLKVIRRDILLYGRSFPPGYERNEHWQIALSLYNLFKNKRWLDAHTVEGSDD